MVDMLASDDWCNGVGLLCTSLGTSILELQTLLFETSLNGLGVAVDVLTVLDRDHVVFMPLRQHLAVLDRLDRSVIVILMHLSVDGGLSLLVTLLEDLLIHHSRSDLLVDGGIMVTRLGPEGKCQLCLSARRMLR